MFLAPKIKYCLTVNKNGVRDKDKTFKGLANLSENLDKNEYFKMFSGNNLEAKVPVSWKKSFSMGVVIPYKMRKSNKCTKHFLCEGCDKLVNRTKKFSANLNQIKRQAPDEFGHMLPKYKLI